MALTLNLKYVENLRGNGDRLAKVTFRGVAHYSKVKENTGEYVVFNEVFHWPVARSIESCEQVEVQLINYNKYRSNKVIGSFRMVLQELVQVGQVKISDCLLDDNNVVMRTCLSLELTYNAPDGSVGNWQDETFEGIGQIDDHDEERHLLSTDQSDNDSLASATSKSLRGSRLSVTSKGSHTARSPTKPRKSIRSFMKLGKQRPPAEEDEVEDEGVNVFNEHSMELGVGGGGGGGDSVMTLVDERTDGTADDNTTDGHDMITVPVVAKRTKTTCPAVEFSLKAQDYQVSVTVIEARQLAGLNMDPVVCVQVGDKKKYTSVKESTNCPYYNEYFVFDFHMAPTMLFDKIITITVLQSRALIRSNKMIGSFKLDVSTVFNNADHQFYHKWALLSDPDDINSGPKGYVKCDIAVVGKGDSIKTPPKSDKDEDDIEANLLLPEGTPLERQKARFIVKVYRAEGLPKMNTGLMANVKRAFTGESKDLVDPYVYVSFCGHQGKTSVKSGYEPVWNEQVIFTEMFPPLCRRLKIQLRDNESVNDDVIGTHYIDLAQISNDGEKGFLPTYGPCWISLYGSTRQFQMLPEHSHLNEGLGEGVSYRGRILVALKTEILDDSDCGPSMVEVEPCLPVPENSMGRYEEFFLFATIMEVTMIDKKLGDKPMQFELSIGNHGNTMDGKNVTAQMAGGDSSEEEDEEKELLSTEETAPEWNSTTNPIRPSTRDRFYYYLPYEEHKPCLWVKGVTEDNKRRLYNRNMIQKIIDKLEDGLADIAEMIRQERPFAERRLRGVLDELATDCSRYMTLTRGKASGSAGRTRLDKERTRLCQREVDHVGTMARTLRATVSKATLKDKMKGTSRLLAQLLQICVEPQSAMPDIFIWMLSNGKRVAYQRIPAQKIIFSMVEEERGQDCAKVQTLFLKLPGKKSSGPSGWLLPVRLQLYLWLGASRHRKEVLRGLPLGYDDTAEVRRACRISAIPADNINYLERQVFQLRAHMYQARGLIGSDSSGLSDPFARVVIGNQSQCTQVIDETLSPTWDEMLIFNEVIMYGVMDEIVSQPPGIIIEVFDQDRVGKSEFIGRAIARPVVKMSHEKYAKPTFPPQLDWCDIYRGEERAGELLAAFELLQLAPPGDMSGEELPPLAMPSGTELDRGAIMPVPKGIRPLLSKHRIEVLFWGLRQLKRIQLTTVDRPRIDIECAGHVLSSSVITSAKKNPNFSITVKHFDVELPENELYCPPIMIRCVDFRNFGRYILVGTHVIDNIHKFMYIPVTKTAKEAMKKFLVAGDGSKELIGKPVTQSLRLPLSRQHSPQSSRPVMSLVSTDVAVTIDEKQPLIAKHDTVITLDVSSAIKASNRDMEAKKKKRTDASSVTEDEEGDLDGMDWWSKYHASMDTMMRDHEKLSPDVPRVDQIDEDNKKLSDNLSHVSQQPSSPYGAIPNGNLGFDGAADADFDPKQAKRFERELKKMEARKDGDKKTHTLKGTAKAASLAAKLSPKLQRRRDSEVCTTAQLTIYPTELELQPQFSGFSEWLHTFEMFRGKKTSDTDDNRVVGVFKGSLKIYKIPLPPDIEDSTVTGGDPQAGLFQGLPSNDPLHVLVRVYIVKAIDLHPADMNGKADPYIILRLGKTTINDKENYISKQLNPVFGKCFEIEASFPMDSLLTVQIYDWDLVGIDDLIGETKIDLENRYYTRHRATCGISQKYDGSGYNAWRDPMKPTQILMKLCKDAKLDGPYYQPGRVRVGSRVFSAPIENDEEEGGTNKQCDEQLALAVLQHWDEMPKVGCKLVPEHIETRALYHADKQGIEQGKLQMWIDMFPMDMPPPGPPVDISPRKPVSYELRCIIWNTDDVVLEDDAFFTGEKMSDIYVKGWVKGQEDMQSTDIHYRSLTGEGNFNWRFIFPFDYLVAEEKIVISRKETLFSWDETETKVPARLELQVWDADHFSADDFLGALTLDLNSFPRGAKSAKQCSLNMLRMDGNVPQMSLFKHKRVKGWWPFHVKNEGEEMELTGKVEAELHLLTIEDAEKHPAGLARNEPDPLDKPNRPDTTFIWFCNPLKSIRYIIWHQYKWAIFKALLFIALVVLIALFFYNMPGYMAKKMLGA